MVSDDAAYSSDKVVFEGEVEKEKVDNSRNSRRSARGGHGLNIFDKKHKGMQSLMRSRSRRLGLNGGLQQPQHASAVE